jgi:hypothetical protein
MSTNVNPVCPDDCTSTLAENTYNYCTQHIVTGEVDHVFLAAGDAECFTDWTLPGEWAARISPDSLDPDAIRRFRGIGDLPEGASDEVEISLCQKWQSEKTFTLNFDIEDVSDENYNFMRTLECNNVMKGWFSSGGKLFGDNCGIDVSVKANYKIDRGCKTLHKILLVFTWDNQFHPARCTNPIA